MIISHKHRFIYLKTQKTGSTSLELALSKFCGPDDAITTLDPADEAIRERHGLRRPQNYTMEMKDWRFLNRLSKYDIAKLIYYRRMPKKYHAHMPAREIRENIGDEIWNSYLKFTIVRNPYDRALSLYYFNVNRRKPANHFRDFKHFMRLRATDIYWNWEIYTENDAPVVDRVVRYENFGPDVDAIGAELGLEESLSQLTTELQAKSGFRNDDHRKPKDLDTGERAMLYHLCRPEIDAFGYTPDA